MGPSVEDVQTCANVMDSLGFILSVKSVNVGFGCIGKALAILTMISRLSRTKIASMEVICPYRSWLNVEGRVGMLRRRCLYTYDSR